MATDDKGKKMKVLSLFDGISCGRLALERAGIPVEKYYASEIDKYAIQVTQKNRPDTIQVGDVTKLNYLELLDVDMVIGGSPCQDLSIAKQNREGLRGARSGLFWKYVEALEVIHPKWFLLENVASMRNEDRDAITATLKKIYPETECIMINSALVSAQQRKRYYWTNWHVEQPQDKGILLKDILESGESLNDKSHCLDANYYKGTSLEHYSEKRNRELVAVPIGCRMVGRKTDEKGVRHDDWDIPTQQRIEINENPQKANCISTVSKDSMVAEPVTKRSLNNLRTPEDKANCLLSTSWEGAQANGMTNVPERIAEVVSQISSRDFELSFQKNGNIRPNKGDPKKTGIGEAPTIYSVENKAGTIIASHPVYVHNIAPERIGQLEGRGNGQANRIYSVRGKSVCLGANGGGGGAKTGLYKVDLPDGDYIIRKLTPVECERLQTLPDGWTAGVSNTQRYKAIGNGWTVDVIAWIFSQLPKE